MKQTNDNKIRTIPEIDRNSAINYSDKMNPEQKVNYLVQNLRNLLYNQKNLSIITDKKGIKANRLSKQSYGIEDSLKNEGKAITQLLSERCEEKNIDYKQFDISNLEKILQGEQFKDVKEKIKENKHSFLIVSINDKQFLIDCAYKQFFDKNDNENDINLEKIMTERNDKKQLAEQILTKGWAEATPENIKIYLDAFIKGYTKNDEIITPTEQEYISILDTLANNVEQENSNEILFKKIETIAKLKDINGLWKLYNEKISPDSPKKLLKYGAKNVITLKRNLEQNANFDIDIVSTKEKEYFIIKDKEFSNFTIDKNNCLIELTPENINEYLNEYTPDLLKTYLNNLIKENSENENIPLPTLEDYNKFLSITDKNSKFIIDSIPDIKKDFDLIEYNENMPAEEKLESIVQKERKELSKFRDIEKDNLAGDCEDSTRRVIKDCTSKGLEDAIYFSPDRYASGYKKGAGKNNKVEGHNCTIVNIDGQSYLIDCTYRQFFVKENENRHCGKYMLNDENRKEVAERILKNGWVEATPENIKSYMDGFVMAARGSFDDIEITAEEYLKRINNNSDVPIHIITKREIVEASIDRKIAQEENENIENLFENLSKEKKEIQTLE